MEPKKSGSLMVLNIDLRRGRKKRAARFFILFPFSTSAFTLIHGEGSWLKKSKIAWFIEKSVFLKNKNFQRKMKYLDLTQLLIGLFSRFLEPCAIVCTIYCTHTEKKKSSVLFVTRYKHHSDCYVQWNKTELIRFIRNGQNKSR